MDDVTDFHNRAMESADEADQARRRGDIDRYDDLIRQAFDNERAAATLVAADLQLEPTRSVLHRSAASLAIEAGEIDVAFDLIATALEGNPPQAIAEELKALLLESPLVSAAAAGPNVVSIHFPAGALGAAASGEQMFTLQSELSPSDLQKLGALGRVPSWPSSRKVSSPCCSTSMRWVGATPPFMRGQITSPSRTTGIVLTSRVPGSTRLRDSVPWADEEESFTVLLDGRLAVARLQAYGGIGGDLADEVAIGLAAHRAVVRAFGDTVDFHAGFGARAKRAAFEIEDQIQRSADPTSRTRSRLSPPETPRSTTRTGSASLTPPGRKATFGGTSRPFTNTSASRNGRQPS